jgi:hypothetical protein
MASDLVGPAFIAAVVSGAISVIGVWLNRSTTIRVNREKIAADLDLAERKFVFDKELAERTLTSESALAERKFQYDRELLSHQRLVELAEGILSDFYQCSDIFHEIRAPVSSNTEAAERIKKDYESEGQSLQADSYFVPIARIKKNSEFLSNLLGKRYRSRAILGSAIDVAFKNIHDVIVKIQVSAATLINITERGEVALRQDLKFVRELETDIWQSMPSGDPVQRLIEQAIEVAEAACRPILEKQQ